MNGPRRAWLDDPRHVTGLFRGLLLFSALLLAAGLFVEEGAAHLPWDRWVGFSAFLGFVSYSFIVFAGRAWRKVVGRPEDYYDR